MSDIAIVALPSLVGTMAGTYFANRKASALIAYRLEQLKEKVNKYNQVAERTFRLEGNDAHLEKKITDSILPDGAKKGVDWDTFSSLMLVNESGDLNFALPSQGSSSTSCCNANARNVRNWSDLVGFWRRGKCLSSFFASSRLLQGLIL